jgi:membrane associated rhomboid family serine protease
MYLESILKYPKIIKYFLISGFFGGLLHSIFFNQDFSLVGSSGSIMGLLIILAFVSKSNILRLIIFSIFLYEFLNCLVTENDKISHLCHVGGAIGGLVISLVDRKNLRIIK